MISHERYHKPVNERIQSLAKILYFVFVECQRANDMRAWPNKVNDTKRDYVIMKIIMISVRELIARDTALAI